MSFHSKCFAHSHYLFEHGPALQRSVSNRLARLNQLSANIENVCAHSIFSTSCTNNNNAPHTYRYACVHVITRVVELSGTWTITKNIFYWKKAPGQCFSVSEFSVICFSFSWGSFFALRQFHFIAAVVELITFGIFSVAYYTQFIASTRNCIILCNYWISCRFKILDVVQYSGQIVLPVIALLAFRWIGRRRKENIYSILILSKYLGKWSEKIYNKMYPHSHTLTHIKHLSREREVNPSTFWYMKNATAKIRYKCHKELIHIVYH